MPFAVPIFSEGFALLYYTYLLHAVERIPYVQNKSTVASMETKVETERFNEKDIEICQ